MEDSKEQIKKKKNHKKARSRKMGRMKSRARHPGEEEEEEWWRSGSSGEWGTVCSVEIPGSKAKEWGRKRNGQQE